MAVKDLKGGERFSGVLIVRSAQTRETKAGKPFLKLELGDKTGTIGANIWDSGEAEELLYRPGNAVQLSGAVDEHERFGRSLKVTDAAAAAEGSYDPAELFDGPPTPLAEMEAQLRQLISTVAQPHLAQLLDLIIGPDAPTWPDYRDAPAAKRFHQAYRHGLLEHSLTVAQAVAKAADIFPGINRDLAVSGALIHDIGKLDAYTTDPAAIDFTDNGRLQGEIPLGFFRVKTLAAGIDGFPPELEQGICHIILSHHGRLEHGSPVVPQTREATLVHMMDHLGGQLGSFDRLEKSLAPGSEWSGFDTAIGGGAWFPQAADA
jgi:3'-5' exoribonuclease